MPEHLMHRYAPRLRLSKTELQSEFVQARLIPGRRDGTAGRQVDRPVRSRKARRIREIEHLRPEFNYLGFRNREIFNQRHVELDQPIAAH